MKKVQASDSASPDGILHRGPLKNIPRGLKIHSLHRAELYANSGSLQTSPCDFLRFNVAGQAKRSENICQRRHIQAKLSHGAYHGQTIRPVFRLQKQFHVFLLCDQSIRAPKPCTSCAGYYIVL